MLNLPSSTSVVEVAPRDGLQSFSRRVDTSRKIELIELLIAAGFKTIEITSFAHPKAIPYLDDAEALCAALGRRPGLTFRGLVPNARGAQRAVAAGIDEIVGLLTASVAYTRRNQNMTPEQAADQAIESFHVANAAGRGYSAGIGMAMWCPYEGEIATEQVARLVERLHDAGVRRMSLAGSMGMEHPVQVHGLFASLCARWPDARFGYHVHNMAGFGAANILAALQGGASWIESAICGLGGGTATPQPTGNYPTEDLVHLLESCGVRTSLEIDTVIAAARGVGALLDIEPLSHACRAVRTTPQQQETPHETV